MPRKDRATRRERCVVDMRTPVFWNEDYADSQSPVVLSFPAARLEYRDDTYGLIAFIKSLKRNSDLEVGDWYYVSGNTNIMGLLGPHLAGVSAYKGTRLFLEALGQSTFPAAQQTFAANMMRRASST